MVRFLLAFLLLPAAAVQAQQRPAGRASRSPSALHRVLRKTLTVTGPCAALYSPDAVWIARSKRKGDLAGFYTVADDMLFYLSQTREYLVKRNIRVIDTDAAWIRFERGQQFVKEVDLHHDKYGWGLLLFNGHDAPREADLVSPEDDVRRVFNR